MASIRDVKIYIAEGLQQFEQGGYVSSSEAWQETQAGIAGLSAAVEEFEEGIAALSSTMHERLLVPRMGVYRASEAAFGSIDQAARLLGVSDNPTTPGSIKLESLAVHSFQTVVMQGREQGTAEKLAAKLEEHHESTVRRRLQLSRAGALAVRGADFASRKDTHYSNVVTLGRQLIDEL